MKVVGFGQMQVFHVGTFSKFDLYKKLRQEKQRHNF
jgi:hypothetical protein